MIVVDDALATRVPSSTVGVHVTTLEAWRTVHLDLAVYGMLYVCMPHGWHVSGYSEKLDSA